MSGLNCPYCDAGFSVCHDDGFGFEEGVKYQMKCYKCKKSFMFKTYISFYYEAEKADCLNVEITIGTTSTDTANVDLNKPLTKITGL